MKRIVDKILIVAIAFLSIFVVGTALLILSSGALYLLGLTHTPLTATVVFLSGFFLGAIMLETVEEEGR